MVLLAAGRPILFSDRILVQAGYHPGSPRDFRALIKSVFLFTAVLERAGFILLILECLPLLSGVSIEEVAPPERFIGKSLRDLDLRNKYGIQVVAVRELVPERTLYVPPADFVIKDSDVLIVMGDEKMLEKVVAS
jgi:hypothetical protein